MKTVIDDYAKRELKIATTALKTPSSLWIKDQYGISDRTSKDQQLYRGLGIDPTGLRIEDQLSALDLNWSPSTTPVSYGELGEYQTDVARALFRPTDGQFMGIVSDKWFSECQSFENILGTFKKFCDESSLTLERVGVIQTLSRKTKGGNQQLYLKLWAVAGGLENAEFDLGEGDLVEAKLMLTCPYFYGNGYTMNLSAYRKVCNNGLHEAVRVGQKVIQHSGESTIKNIELALQNAQTAWQNKQEQLTLLADTPISQEEAAIAIISKFGYPDRSFDEQPKLVQAVIEMYNSNAFIGSHFTTAQGTAWGLLNCLTQYFQHENPSKNPHTQLSNIWSGKRCKDTNEFLKSISAFATEKRNREKIRETAQSVAVRAW